MRTIRTKLYKFSELSTEAKQKALDNFRYTLPTDHVYDDAHETVKAFHEIFGTKSGSRSWLEVNTGHIDDNILNLKGLRLRTYIINNFWKDIYKGKYFSLWSKTEKSFKHYKDGHPVLKSRYSKVIFDNSCVLTGVCYDYSLMQPIYDFIERYNEKKDYYSYMDFETLLNDCFSSLEKDIEDEIQAMTGDEYVTEHIEANELEFLKDGQRY